MSRSTWIRSSIYKEASDGQILEEGIKRSGLDVILHRPPARPTHARREHDSVLHLLLDVRLPGGLADLIWAAGRLAHSRVPARWKRRAGRRSPAEGTAAPRTWQNQPEQFLRSPIAQLPPVRPAVRLRAIRRHGIEEGIRRNVHRAGECLLLLDGDERAVRRCRRCPRDRVTVPQGDVPVSRHLKAEGHTGGPTAVWKRRHPDRNGEGPGDSGIAVSGRRRGRVEHHEVMFSLPRGIRCRSVEHADPGETPRAVSYVTQCVKDAPGVFRGRVRLRQGAASCHRAAGACAARPLEDARHRRLRPQARAAKAPGFTSRSMRDTWSSSPRLPRSLAAGRSTRQFVAGAIRDVRHQIPIKSTRRCRSGDRPHAARAGRKHRGRRRG